MSKETETQENSWTNFFLVNPLGIGALVVFSSLVALLILPFAIRQIGNAFLAYREVRAALLA